VKNLLTYSANDYLGRDFLMHAIAQETKELKKARLSRTIRSNYNFERTQIGREVSKWTITLNFNAT